MSDAVDFIATKQMMLQQNGEYHEDKYNKLCQLMNVSPGQLRRLFGCIDELVECAPKMRANGPALDQLNNCVSTLRELPEFCSRLDEFAAKCNRFEALLKIACCPAHRQLGNVTLDEYSSKTTIDIDVIEQDLGDPYVNQYPVPTGKFIRLVQSDSYKAGFIPEEIEINFSLSNNDTNYLAINVQFYVNEKSIGSRFKGSLFLDADGRTKRVKFPKWRGNPVLVGSEDVLAVEIEMTGANSITQATVVIHLNAEGWYELCGVGSGMTGGC